MNYADLEIHPIIADLPVMSPEEFAGVADDIKTVGMRDPIVLLKHDGKKKIIDGRHRLKIRIDQGPPLTAVDFIDFDPVWGDPVDWVISQMQGRTRTPSIKAAEAVLLMERTPARQQKGRTVEVLAKRFGIGANTVEWMRQVRQESPELFAAVCQGKVKAKAAHARLKHKRRERDVRNSRRSTATTPSSCRLILGDNVEQMSKLPAGSVRVIFADPPYNNGWTYRDDPTGDRMSDEDYLAAMGEWMEQAHRLLADDGSLFVVIDDRYTSWFGVKLESQGFKFRRLIIWWETFGNYQSGEGNLSTACRFIHYVSKTDKPLFNTTELRDSSARQTVYKDKRANELGKVPDSVWSASRITGNHSERVPWQDKGQAPQLPIAVPERCILLASNPFDLVLDPFNGNGTTAVAAVRNRRQYIGIDRDQVGLRRSEQWINSMLQQEAK